MTSAAGARLRPGSFFALMTISDLPAMLRLKGRRAEFAEIAANDGSPGPSCHPITEA